MVYPFTLYSMAKRHPLQCDGRTTVVGTLSFNTLVPGAHQDEDLNQSCGMVEVMCIKVDWGNLFLKMRNLFLDALKFKKSAKI